MDKVCGKDESDMSTKKPPGRPLKENLLEGLVDLETGEPAEFKPSNCFPSMKAAAHALKIDIAILRDARAKDCPAFRTGGNIHREQLLEWLKKHGGGSMEHQEPHQEYPHTPEAPEEDFIDTYTIPDEAGGVGQTLKSLQAYERRAKQVLDKLERSTNLHPSVKADKVKAAQDAWLKVVNSLLKYDLAVDMAKRESGELMPLADAVKGVHALLAWHTVAISDALRNVIPELEGKNKYEIATLLDPALRSSIYRNFKLGVKLGKIPEWMGKTAAEFVASEPALSLEQSPKGDKPPASSNLDEY